jgi:hypothetical protein
MLSATGTADSTTFLRGDNSWTAAGGDNTPAFQAYMSSDLSITHDLDTKIPYDTENFDTDSAYDNTTNYRFTVPTGEGGKYFVYMTAGIEGPAQTTHKYSNAVIKVNGSSHFYTTFNFRANFGETVTHNPFGIITLSEDDYIEFFIYITTSSGSAGLLKNYSNWTRAGAYKMIGL